MTLPSISISPTQCGAFGTEQMWQPTQGRPLADPGPSHDPTGPPDPAPGRHHI